MKGRRVAVVGGGIAGLVSARRLAGDHDVTLFEAASSTGGRITTALLRGRPYDPGPDAFIRRNPAATALAGELGLGATLVAPSARGAALFARERLTPLPAGLAVGIPTSFGALWSSGTVTRRAALRAGADLWLGPLLGGGTGPSAAATDDRSVAEVVGRRLGRAVLDNLVDPLVGGINASDVDSLSFTAALPQLAALLGDSRSLMRALRPVAAPPATSDAPPVFSGLSGGLGSLVDALAADVAGRGVVLRTASPVRTLAATRKAWRLATDDREEDFDALVLALPAPLAGELLGAVPTLAEGLIAIPYAGVLTAAFAFSETAVPAALSSRLRSLLTSTPDASAALPGAGVLVGRATGTLTTAFSFTSTKWPRSANPGEVVIRASAGRDGDHRALELDDAALTAALGEELSRVLGIVDAPLEVLVTRHPASFPQYVKGHLALVRALRSATNGLPPIALTGAAYDGIGIPACIAGAELQAGELARTLLG